MALVTCCPVCGRGLQSRELPRRVTAPRADSLRPTDTGFGRLAGELVRCRACRHGWVAASSDPLELDAQWSASYTDAEDEVTLSEEAGQQVTASRGLAAIERYVVPGTLVDLGCWTGSFLVAARARGWRTVGVEPARWAVEQAAARSLDVRQGTLAKVDLPSDTFDAVVMADVLEHLWAPATGVAVARRIVGAGGVLLATVPDAGSVMARMLGRRWWSVVPMHVQFFTAASLTSLLTSTGFRVVEVTTHPKTFSVRYYADRLGAFMPPARPLLAAATRRGLGDRLVTPDFRDRLMVVALAA